MGVTSLMGAIAAILFLRVDAAPLTVHIIAHSHCDPGWLESFEGYYNSQVNRILSSVVQELGNDSNRRFVWAEMSFWMRWYEVQDDQAKSRVKKLVDSGQLEFIGGGWVQNDEANPDPISIIAQLTEGHEYLLSLFGKRPRIAWQIDPFGHSAAFAAVAASAGYEALVINRIEHTVKDALKERAAMEFVWHPYATHPDLTADTEGVTMSQVSPVQKSSVTGLSYSNASIYTHVLHTHYSAPRGFDFENPEGQPISEYGVAERAKGLAREVRMRARSYRTPHLLVPFGDDFKFQDAARQFNNMDQLVKYVNTHNGADGNPASDPVFEGLILRYSTLSEYFDAVHSHVAGTDRPAPAGGALTVPIPVYGPSGLSDGGVDFFPYADNPTSFWTGYYVSRPQLKMAIRRTAATLRAGEALVAMVRPWAQTWQDAASTLLEAFADTLGKQKDGEGVVNGEARAETLKSASLAVAPYASFSWLAASQRLEQVRLDAALCLHHDAITGTSRDNVVHDYTRRMSDGYEDVLGVATDVASLLLGGLHKAQVAEMHDPSLGAEGALSSVLKGRGSGTSLHPAPLTSVPHVLPVLDSVELVVTQVKGEGTETLLVLGKDTQAHPVVMYNPSGWARRDVACVAVDVAGGAVGAEDDDSAIGACKRTSWPYAVVTDESGVVVASQWVSVIEESGAAAAVAQEASTSSKALPSWARTGTRYELSFSVDLPSMSLRTYFVTVAWEAHAPEVAATLGARACGATNDSLLAAGAAGSTAMLQIRQVGAFKTPAVAGVQPRISTVQPTESSTVVIENACIALEVSTWTGLLVSITRKFPDGGPVMSARKRPSPVKVAVRQRFGVYETHQSGAYMFRPVNEASTLSMQEGEGQGSVSVVTEIISSRAGVEGEEEGGIQTSKHSGLLKLVRVAGDKFSQTIRLTDTIGWSGYTSNIGMSGRNFATLCSDALHPDAAFEVIPTVHAGGNEELVLILETDIDVTAKRDSGSTSARDNIAALTYTSPESRVEGAEEGSCGATTPLVPFGWWTSDGLGLLRRKPSPEQVDDKKLLTRQFFPFNTLTRIAGTVAGASAKARSGETPSAWLSVYTQSPFGVTARSTDIVASSNVGAGQVGGNVEGKRESARGTRIEIMLHRHLNQDDGRGLATGVFDTTVITPRLLFTLGAAVLVAQQQKKETVSEDGKDSWEGAATTSTCGMGAPGAGTPHDIAARHEDWTWRWGARAAQHSMPLLMLHADLAGVRAELDAGSGNRFRDRMGKEKLLSEVPDKVNRPPSDLSLSVGGQTIPFVLAELPVPREAWTSRFSTRWEGLPAQATADDSSGVAVSPDANTRTGPLPPWLHLLTVQPRDAVTDDVVVRLQNVGGPAVGVDMSRLLSGRGISTPGSPTVIASGDVSDSAPLCIGGALATTGLRERSLTMNGMAQDGRKMECGLTCAAMQAAVVANAEQAKRIKSNHLAYESLFGMLHEFGAHVRVSAGRALREAGSMHWSALATEEELAAGLAAAKVAQQVEDVARQNTNEEGVFISDAALEKAGQKAGRLLLEVSGGRKGKQGQAMVATVVKNVRSGALARAVKRDARKQIQDVDSKAWTSMALPAPDALASLSDVKLFLAVLPPASFKSFFLTLSPSANSITNEVGGHVGEGHGSADGAVPIVTLTLHGAHGGGGRVSTGRNAGGPEVRTSSKAGKVTNAERLALWLGLLEEVPISAAEKSRLLSELQSGQDLSAVDERRLYRLTRLAVREHKQEMPAGLEEVLTRVIWTRRVEAAGKSREHRPGPGLSSTSFWSEEALAPTEADRQMANKVLGKHSVGRTVKHSTRKASKGGDEEGTSFLDEALEGEKPVEPVLKRRGEPGSKELESMQEEEEEDESVRRAVNARKKARGTRSRASFDRPLKLDTDSIPVDVSPFVKGESGEDISIGSIAIALCVWLLAAWGLLTALQCLCGGRRGTQAPLLPTTVTNAMEQSESSVTSCWKRTTEPSKVH